MKSVASAFNGKLNILVKYLPSTFLNFASGANLTSLNQINYFVQVNNAAIATSKDTTDTTAEDISNILSINFEAPYHLCQLGQPLLKALGAGNILFISSVSTVVALPRFSIYSPSKGLCLCVYKCILRIFNLYITCQIKTNICLKQLYIKTKEQSTS